MIGRKEEWRSVMKIRLKNARWIDESSDFIGDVLVEDGRIAALLSPKAEGEADEYIDMGGKIVMPAFIELHAHFREPGYPEKETMETGAWAALHGGYTYVNMMGNTKPIASNLVAFEYAERRFREIDLIDGNQTITVTENFDGVNRTDLASMAGRVRVLSEDGKGVMSSRVMYDTMSEAKKYDMVVMVHAEDMDMTPVDYRISENLETFRDLYLSEVTGAHLHLSHVSTKEALKAIAEAKEKGVRVTCEVTPHHIMLFDFDYKVNPPIRAKEDVDAVIRYLKNGVVDAIATDHAPHTEEDKKKGAPGLVGLETAFSICNTALIRTGEMTLSDLSRVMSANPARIMSIPKGRLEIGYDADFAVVDLEEEVVVDVENFKSKSRNTPFAGKKLYGRVLETFKAGKRYIWEK